MVPPTNAGVSDTTTLSIGLGNGPPGPGATLHACPAMLTATTTRSFCTSTAAEHAFEMVNSASKLTAGQLAVAVLLVTIFAPPLTTAAWATAAFCGGLGIEPLGTWVKLPLKTCEAPFASEARVNTIGAWPVGVSVT